MNHTANNDTLASPEHAMSNISAMNAFPVNPAEQNYNPMLNYRNMAESDYNNHSVMIHHQQMTYGDGLSLSGASACSSMDIRTPDIHPVYSNGNSIPTEQLVGQTIATQSTFRDQLASPTSTDAPTQQWHQQQDATMLWTPTTDTFIDLSYPPSDHSEENDESSSNSCLSEIEEKMALYCNSPHLLVETNEEGLSSSSMRKSPNNRRNTVSSFPCTDEWCDPTEKELRRQSMNSFLIKPRIKLEEQQESKECTSLFCHLSREELIQRVVQLEREKQLNSKLSGSTAAAAAAASSDKEGPNSPPPPTTTTSNTAEGSDEDEAHPCRWSGCDTSATSLDQLIVHIKDVHIGSGKAAYFCEWESCPRERKPFLKRHKMQNHMRTHTGERPFECHVEGCDKRFSRPDSLSTHVKTHSSIRPFACLFENCSKAYFHSRSLRKHTKSHEAAAAAAAASTIAVPTAITTTLAPAPNTIATTTTTEVDIREEDVIVHRQHPYDRSLKPARYYRQQQTSSCGSEARQHQETPSHPVMESANFAPMTINTALLQQQTQQQQQVYGNATKMMEICEPAQPEQQIFAAGSAYNDDYNSHVVEQQLFQHHQRLQQQQQLLEYQQQQHHHQLSYPQHPQAYVSYSSNNQPLSVQLHVQQQQPSYHGYNYTIY